MSDIWTMMWKESKDLLFRDRWVGAILPLLLIGMLGVGLPLAFGLSWAAVGTTFAAVAGITAQATASARAATGSAVGLLGIAYALRAASDAGSPAWLGWVSPVGWGQRVRAYQGEQWWVLLLPSALAIAATALAFALVQRR